MWIDLKIEKRMEIHNFKVYTILVLIIVYGYQQIFTLTMLLWPLGLP